MRTTLAESSIQIASSKEVWKSPELDTLKKSVEASRNDVMQKIGIFRANGSKVSHEQLEKMPEKHAIIDPLHIHLWISDPSGKVIHIRIPKQLEVGKPEIVSLAGHGSLTITKKDANGYNSEYAITDQKGNRWTVVGSVFTTNNPLRKKQETTIEKIESDIKEIRDDMEKLESELLLIDTHMKKAKKGDARKTLEDRRKMLKELSIPQKKVEIRKKGEEIREIRKKMETLPPYTSFPYIPYQDHLNTPKTRKEGFEHVKSLVNRAYTELQKTGRTKISDGGDERTGDISRLADKAPKDLALLLNIIERMDYQVYYTTIPGRTEARNIPSKGKKGSQQVQVKIPAQTVLRDPKEIDQMMKEQSEKSLATIGLNREHAFRWQRSQIPGRPYHEGALGIAQLIPETYQIFRDKYSILRGDDIPPRHEEGAKNQIVSLKFQIMHLYDEYNSLPLWIRRDWDRIMSDPKAKVGLYSILAAGYNGSLVKALDEAGLRTQGDHKLEELYPERLKKSFTDNKERLTYVMKLEYLLKAYSHSIQK